MAGRTTRVPILVAAPGLALLLNGPVLAHALPRPASLSAAARHAQTSPGHTPDSPPTYSGRDGQLDVPIPRLDADAVIDGTLDDEAWQSAARLTGFSKYAPVDGSPADTATEVLVWYSPTAIYFGIRATAPASDVRATLADRDRIDTDDHVLIFLSTFNDGRQAFVFGVNPLGVQADGALVEGTSQQSAAFSGLRSGRESADLSPDFVFHSRGRLTPEGFEVEIEIPFKSLRYQTTEPQDWGLSVTRVSAATSREDSWTPATREGASFLAQSGRLVGLTGLRRGLVLDLTPVATAKIDGGSDATGWAYETGAPEFGLNLRWGVTSNLTLNGTINPDFSQVESDAGQFQFDPRQALYFPEKRPFFLDALEQFATPNNLIYTRRIVAPLAAAKVTGRVGGGTSVALLSAVDDKTTSASGQDHPIFGIVRVQQDVGEQSKVGLVYTDRIEGNDSNRVAGADARLVWRDIYSLQAQAAVSRTTEAGHVATAPLWQVTADRSGHRYAFRASVRGVDDEFLAAAGFISRTGIATTNLTNQAIFYGGDGAPVEKWTSDVVVDGTWQYDDFVGGRGAQDRKLHFNNNVTFRGGWRLGGSVLIESFGYDEELYQDYALGLEGPGGVELLPFMGTPRLPNLDYVVSFDTPTRRGLTLDGYVIWGKDENFFEWASADIIFANAGVSWRPTGQLRVDGRFQLQSYERRTDDSTVGIRRIPRLKVEYQVTRAVFLRLVGELDASYRDALRDDSRTDLPIYVRDASTGEYARTTVLRADTLRLDALFSYQPTPGTVVFAGYGSSLAGPDDARTGRLRRVSDGFFVKVSYLFRL